MDWTLVNNGWLMDYFLTKGKTWMPAIPDEFPVDPNGWGVCVRGTGDEPQSFTSARDIGKAVVELLAWEGEWVRFFFFFHLYRHDESHRPTCLLGSVGWLQISELHLLMHMCLGADYVCCWRLAYIQRNDQSDGDVLR